ncbi:MAG: hypothetical protein KDN20_17580 [Verrucomicrobiae bacterium]|nr:hypothetical protein [Verrucomicrobiae bacterium]
MTRYTLFACLCEAAGQLPSFLEFGGNSYRRPLEPNKKISSAAGDSASTKMKTSKALHEGSTHAMGFKPLVADRIMVGLNEPTSSPNDAGEDQEVLARSVWTPPSFDPDSWRPKRTISCGEEIGWSLIRTITIIWRERRELDSKWTTLPITDRELALRSKLRISEARKQLDGLADKGVFEVFDLLNIPEARAIIYVPSEN